MFRIMSSPTPPHCLHTIGSLNPELGGPTRSVTALCSALARHAAPIDLLTVRDHEAVEGLEAAMSPTLRIQFCPGANSVSGFLWSNRSFLNAVRSIHRSAPNGELIMHDHGMWLPTNHLVARYATRHRIARVVSPRGMLSSWSLAFRKVKKRIAWALYQARDLRSANLLHVTSQQEADDVRALGFRQPLAIIGNGIDLPDRVLKSGTTSGERRALFLSRIHPKKGVLNLIAAWARVRPEGWRLVIAGPNAEGHQDEAESMADSLGVSDVIEFPGPIADHDKWDLFTSSSLFVLPTFSENFGIVVAEALASGLPVITTKAAPWKSLESHQCGWWIDVGVEPLVVALQDATGRTTSALADMGARARALADRDFSWDQIAGQMLEVYLWLIHGSSPPKTVFRD